MSNHPDTYHNKQQLLSQEKACFNESLEIYVPDEEQSKHCDSLLAIIKQCEDIGIMVTVFGGYGLDGIYGKLTRNHDDIDMLIPDNQIDDTERTLKTLGYQRDLLEIDKYVYRNMMIDPTFKVELASTSTLRQFTEKEEAYFISLVPNASLNDQPFRAMTLRGQREVIKIQNLRSKKEGWGDYPAWKRQNQTSLINELEQRNIT